MDVRIRDVAYNDGVSPQPVVVSAWRGRCSIPIRNIDIYLSAHLSNKPHLNVSEVASMMPKSLCLEIFPRLDVWPSIFKRFPPTEYSIDLFLFSERRDEKVLDNLLTDAIVNNLALKAMIGEAELLIFPSLQLPEKLHRFQGKLYFWGLFRGQKHAFSHESDYDVHTGEKPSLSLNAGNHMSFEGKEIPKCNSSEHGPSTQAAQADKRGKPLDDSWKHAKPLDELRQNIECKYCGFVSVRGGISRLKAHLGGGNPRTHLPGCQKVSPEVKKVMADWYSRWVKNSKAPWGKEIQAAATKPFKRGRPLDDAWEHAIPLDEISQGAKCKYCDFVSKRGGIARLKEHLSGGDPTMLIKGCPNVSPEVKDSMSNGISKSTKNTKGRKMETFRDELQATQAAQADKRGKPLDDSWKHAKPLDELRQKIECKYCGFVSVRGGISRLKAHLGGGNPVTRLPGCQKVSPEVKKVMADWYSRWVKNSKAPWAKEIQAATKPFKRGRPLDDAWEHAIPLDEISQGAKCKYCNFVSKRGGIARLKAHLSGGDPTMSIKGCPNVSPEVKYSISNGISESTKNAKGRKMETFRDELQEEVKEDTTNEAQLTSKRHCVVHETLDEITSTCRKANLQNQIDKKNAKLQNIQSEIQSLESQLSSML